MNHPRIAIAAGLVLGACSGANPSTQAERQDVRMTLTRGGRLAPSTTRPTADACPSRRFVGVRSGARCPTAQRGLTGIWIGGNPFTSTFHTGALPQSLADYCQYEWSGRGAPDTRLLPADGRRAASDWLQPDCQVVAPLGSAFESALAPSLEDAFMRQVQEAPLRAGPAHERAALISVIDASPGTIGETTARSGRSLHGYVVGRVARQISCQDPEDTSASRACMSYVDHPLALPRVDKDNVDYAQGGYFGSHLDLAVAIFEAVARFDDKNVPVTHQILNLSVGWSPQWGGAHPPTDPRTPAAIRAVHDAIDYARCTGALVVAAAGNATGSSAFTDGMMFPAAWTTRNSSCGGRLLEAVGGVDPDDAPLANGRPASTPRLVAPGQHAAARDRHTAPPGSFTGVLSGTSVSAAVLSGAAAVVWGYRPELTADQVVDLVYAAAFDLGQTADVCAGPSCAVRRISVCRAIRQACQGQPTSNCPTTLPTCGPIDQVDAPQTTFLGQPVVAALAQTVTTTHPFVGTFQGPVAACGATVYGTSTAPEDVCPFKLQTAYIARPYVDPQPGVPICPECFVTRVGSTWTGYFAVNPKLPATAAKVSLDVVVDGEALTFELEPGSWTPGDTFKVTGIPIPAGAMKKVGLSYVIVDPSGEAYTGTEPLLVY